MMVYNLTTNVVKLYIYIEFNVALDKELSQYDVNILLIVDSKILEKIYLCKSIEISKE